jgi:peptide/nickel transport system substrate-binding protein
MVDPTWSCDAACQAGTGFGSFVWTGAQPTEFGEAPISAALVAQGVLPPVADRLPVSSDILVIPVVNRIGDYGGTWRRAFTSSNDGQNMDRLSHDHPIYWDTNGLDTMEHVIKSWEIDEAYNVHTFTLREGAKWSDGAPLISDNIGFMHEMMEDDELVPSKPFWLKHEGILGQFKKIDDQTFQISWPGATAPNYGFIDLYAGLGNGGQWLAWARPYQWYGPSHYLRQFSLPHNPGNAAEIDKMVSDEGYETWVQLFRQKSIPHRNKDLPIASPWKMISPITGQQMVMERNHYYWATDPEGNQLPYIDRIVLQLGENLEVINLRAIAGEIDFQHRHIIFAKVPVFQKNKEKGNYENFYWPNVRGVDAGLTFNQTWDNCGLEVGCGNEDQELSKWLKSLPVRQAVSLGADREELNETIFLGVAEAKAGIPFSYIPYYPGVEWETYFCCDRDVASANKILDDVGLTAKNADGFRLRTDGVNKPVTFELHVTTASFTDNEGMGELIVRHAAEYGLKINLVVEERATATAHRGRNEHQTILGGGGGHEMWAGEGGEFPIHDYTGYAIRNGLWWKSEGEKGEEPAVGSPIRRMAEIYYEGLQVPRGSPERNALGQEFQTLFISNLYGIGFVGNSPASNGTIVKKNNFLNVPILAANISTVQNPGVARTEQFFFVGGLNDAGQ